MAKYNYLQAMEDDINEYIDSDMGGFLNMLQDDKYAACNDRQELESTLNDELFVSDITGNGNGTYTFDEKMAKENLTFNMKLLKKACEEFNENLDDATNQGAEYCDILIRCYLLPMAISNVANKRRDEINYAFKKLMEQENSEEDER